MTVVMTKASMMGEMAGQEQSAAMMEDSPSSSDPALAKGSGKGQPSTEVGGVMPGCPPASRPT